MLLRSSLLKWVSLWTALAIIYAIGGHIGLSFAEIQPNTSAIWPPTGIGIAALLMFGYRATPGIFFGAFLIELFHLPNTAGLIICIGNTAEAVVATSLIQRFIGPKLFGTVNKILGFIVCVLLGSLCSSSIGVSGLIYYDLISPGLIAKVWYTWTMADLFGGLLLVPLIMTWRTLPTTAVSTRHITIAALLSIVTLGLSALLFSPFAEDHSAMPSIPILLLFLAIWSAHRFRFHGTTLFAIAVVIPLCHPSPSCFYFWRSGLRTGFVFTEQRFLPLRW